MNDDTTKITISDTAGTDRIAVRVKPPGQVSVWDNAKARAKAAEKGEAVALVRTDGSRSGLCVTPAGELRRTVAKPQGKAARKQFKRLRRQFRELAPAPDSTVAKALKRQAAQLCGIGGAR